MREEIYIDYESLLTGKQSLDSLYNEIHPTYINKLKPLYEDLLLLDDNHDNCFSGEEDGLYAINDEINKNDTTINELSIDITETVEMFVEVELGIIDSIKLLDEKNELKDYKVNNVVIKSKGLGTAFLHMTDYNNGELEKIMQKKKPKGPLSDEEYKKQTEILNRLMASGKTEREKATIYATYLAILYPNQLGYFWGGGHCKYKDELMGIDPTWGYPKTVTSEGPSKGSTRPYSVDCSGFVVRSLINGGYDKLPVESTGYYDINAGTLMNQGRTTPITDLSGVQAGDIVNIGTNQHVGIIIDVNEQNGTMAIAHSSGNGGMNITTINTVEKSNCKVGEVLDDSNDPSRKGSTYFETVTRLTYDDE